MSDVEQAVRGGALRPGEKLPSVRALAGQLGVSPSTVSAALAELRRRGVVITRDREGTRINARPPVGTLTGAVVVPPGVRDLATGNPDPLLLPGMTRAVTAAATRARGAPRLYGDEPELQGLTRFARDELRGSAPVWPGEEPDAVVVNGSLDGMERSLAVATTSGMKLAIEDPGYDSQLALVRALGLVPVPVAVDDDGPRPDSLRRALEAGARAVVITVRAHNPTGAAVSAARAAAISDVLRPYPEVLLVENDHLGDVAGTDLHTLTGHVPRWVHVRSYAKTLGPDLRVAVMHGDPDTIDRVRGRQALGPGWVSELLQRTTLNLLQDHQVQKLLETARSTYRTRRQHFLETLERRGLTASGRSGFNVWVPVPDETAAVMALLDHGWAVAPGTRYRQAATRGIRITTSELQPEEGEQVADVLADALRSRGRRSG